MVSYKTVIKNVPKKNHKNVSFYTSTVWEIFVEIININITIKKLVIIHTINNFSFLFDNFIKIIIVET